MARKTDEELNELLKNVHIPFSRTVPNVMNELLQYKDKKPHFLSKQQYKDIALERQQRRRDGTDPYCVLNPNNLPLNENEMKELETDSMDGSDLDETDNEANENDNLSQSGSVITNNSKDKPQIRG